MQYFKKYCILWFVEDVVGINNLSNHLATYYIRTSIILIALILPLPRVFYLIDMASPTKMEIVLHPDDLAHPSNYRPTLLTTALKPTFFVKHLNTGLYRLFHKDKGTITYVYTFSSTIGASKAKAEDFDLQQISVKECSTVDILPSCGVEIDQFVVPKQFIAKPDVVIMIQEGRMEGIMEGRMEGIMEGILKERKRIKILFKEHVDILNQLTTSSVHVPSASPSSSSVPSTLASSFLQLQLQGLQIWIGFLLKLMKIQGINDWLCGSKSSLYVLGGRKILFFQLT